MNTKQIKNDKGFTLVELMVVVAIIGLLSAVAIPNFTRYQARSKTTEAKIHLASIYSALTAFRAEYDSYAYCLDFMGYDPADEAGTRYYTTGFRTAPALTAPANIVPPGGCNNTGTVADGVHHFLAGKRIGGGGLATAAQLPTATTITGTTFLAAAAGNISGTLFNTWTVNENKVIAQTILGY